MVKEEKIQELQLIEQNLQNLMLQKHTFNSRLLENENATKELAKTTKKSYKILGSIMVAVDKKQLEKELKEEKDLLDIRIKNIEKQEAKLNEKANSLKSELLKELKK